MYQTLPFGVTIVRIILMKHWEYEGINTKTSPVVNYFVGAIFMSYFVNNLRLEPIYDPF